MSMSRARRFVPFVGVSAAAARSRSLTVVDHCRLPAYDSGSTVASKISRLPALNFLAVLGPLIDSLGATTVVLTTVTSMARSARRLACAGSLVTATVNSYIPAGRKAPTSGEKGSDEELL